MIQIKHHYDGFKISFSHHEIAGAREISIIVKDVEAIHLCIDHYFIKKHDATICPLCKKETQE